MQKLLIFIPCLLILTLSASAQTAGNFHVYQYTTDNGLPSNGIKGMQWDERTEFLWMATEAGIVRFNGVDFKSYTKENMPSIASERMLSMFRNNAGRIYTTDQPGNIFVIDKNKPALWRKASVSNTLNPYLKNYYLLAVSDTFFLKNADNLASDPFSSSFIKVVCTSDTSCLILKYNTLFEYSISIQNPAILAVERGNMTDLFKINDSYFITTKQNEILLLNTSDHSTKPVAVKETGGNPFKAKNANALLYWQTGMDNPVLIDGEDAWLLKYDGISITAELIFTGIPADSYIRSVQYSKKNKLLFIGTESKGLIVINQNRVESKKRNDVHSKNRNSYYSQVELPDGNILTNESDIIGDHPSNISSLPIKGNFEFNVSQTGEDALWYNKAEASLGHTCLHRYNKITGETKVYDKIKWGNSVAASGTDIYLADMNGIGILDTDSLRPLYRYPKELTGTVTFDFKEINPGILAVATCGGLLRFNIATKKLDTIFTKENICVRSIWKYNDYIFFGTYGSGFYIYKNGQTRSMPIDKNKYLLYTHCFIPDGTGYCWISTNRGLFKANLNELVNAYEKNTNTVYYHYFGKKDGMEMTELNGGCTPCALRLKNNTISFPTMDGLLWVDPEKAVPLLPGGDIFIDEIKVDNNIMDIDPFTRKNLPAHTQEIIIELGFSAWCNKENIYLDYQLNDTLNWKPVTINDEAVIRLNNLPAGNYLLRIRKLNGFGINNYSYRDIHFSISTPWNKQWWFYLLLLLALLGLILLVSHLRTKQYQVRQKKLEKQVTQKTKELLEKNEVLEKNNSIKTRLISIISHDIVTPLKFVTVAGKNLIEKRNLMSEELQQETIQEMTNTSQELHLLSTNILNWIKYQNENRRLVKETFNVHELVSQVFGVLNSLAKQKDLQLVNNVHPQLEIYQFFEPLKILVYNLTTNALNFSEKGSITITAKTEDETLTINVQDEGMGMTAEQVSNIMAEDIIVSSANIDNRKGNGLGYLIIKDLRKMMGATLQISSEKGKGTIVSVQVPVGKTPSAP